jgi:predicted amidophosphoribosyltransferase
VPGLAVRAGVRRLRARFAPPRHRCARCALPFPTPSAVRRCLREPPPLDACHAAVSYGYPWSGLVGRFKFGGEPGWADTFAALLLRDAGRRALVDDARWLVPMPLSRQRLASRGFNQATSSRAGWRPQGRAALAVRLVDTPRRSRSTWPRGRPTCGAPSRSSPRGLATCAARRCCWSTTS